VQRTPAYKRKVERKSSPVDLSCQGFLLSRLGVQHSPGTSILFETMPIVKQVIGEKKDFQRKNRHLVASLIGGPNTAVPSRK
jgi:hypothetical protein